MSDLLHIVKGLAVQPKCVLVLGARTEAMLNWLFSLTASQVILVEPEFAMFEKAGALHSAKGKPDNVSIIHGVPAFETEQKTTPYFTSNVLGFSSVLPPNVIKNIRPALEFTEQEVPVIALKPLLNKFNISESEPCLLIAQLNGGEQQCLNGQLLNDFTHVVIQSSPKPIFGESKPIEKLKKQLVECGRNYCQLAESMPPYSNVVAYKQVNTTQALNYFSQKQKHKEIKESLESKLNTSTNEVKRATEELQHAKNQIQTVNHQAEEKRKQFVEELKHAEQLLKTANQQIEAEQKELAAEKSEFNTELEELRERNSSLEIKLSHSEELVSSLDKRINTIKESANASAIKEKNALKILEFNTKLMSKMQNDLDELRFQFKEKVQAEKALQELIAELHLKLKQASVFYHNLESQFPEIANAGKDFD